MTTPRSTISGRLLSGYGPLLALALLFLLMTVYVPTVTPAGTNEAASRPAGATTADNGVSDTVPGAEGAALTSTGSTTATSTRRGGPGSVGTRAQGVGPCPDRTVQVPGDPYSPPCIAFSGANGGATHQGVTGDSIKVAFRLLREFSIMDALLQLASGKRITDSPDDIRRTADALVQYFNTRFQLYGRKVTLAYYNGRGSITNEVLGGGQEEAEADAITVAEQLKAFADITASTPPYAEALARREILNVGAPYMPRKWFAQHAPYSWSPWPDGTAVAELSMEQAYKRLLGKPARYAGGDLKDRPRTYAIVGPENPWYQETIDVGQQVLEAHGFKWVTRLTYRFDLNSYSNDAANIVAKLKDAKVTTVVCACDPAFLTFLTAKATEQHYQPEWHEPATALVDLDSMAQNFDQDQWSRAFGISFLGPPLPAEAGLGYRAYKSIRDDEPALSVEVMYDQLYVLFIGLQMAGPNLTPDTFQRGMVAYPGGTGPLGRWQFPAGLYTPTRDARELWWDPNRPSPINGRPGSYVDCLPGQRFSRGEWPIGDVHPCQ